MLPITLVDMSEAANVVFATGEALVGTTVHDFTLAMNDTSWDWEITAINATPRGACEEQSTGGTFVCRGPLVKTQRLEAESRERLVVTDTPGFSLNSDRGHGFHLVGQTGSTGVEVNRTEKVTATSQRESRGVFVAHGGAGPMTVTVGEVEAAWNGLEISNDIENMVNPDATTLTLTATGAVTSLGTETTIGSSGVSVQQFGTGDFTINAAAVTGHYFGIYAKNRNASGNNTTITASGPVTGRDGIYFADYSTTGAFVLNLHASVIAMHPTPTDRDAINMRKGASHRIVLHPGAGVIPGAVSSNENAAGATLEFTGAMDATGSTSFDLAQMSGFTNVTGFEKTGTGTWTLTGTQPMDKAFASAAFTDAGTLRLSGAEFRPGSTAFTIPMTGTLEVYGESMLHGNLAGGGHLSFSASGDEATGDMLTVMGGYTTGGSVPLNVNLNSGDSDGLIVTGDATRGTDATTVDLRSTVGDPNMAGLRGVVLIDVAGTSMGDEFTAGKLHMGTEMYDKAIVHFL